MVSSLDCSRIVPVIFRWTVELCAFLHILESQNQRTVWMSALAMMRQSKIIPGEESVFRYPSKADFNQ